MLDADDRQADLAMVSRIRVETRGGSMQAAERVAFMLLDHARMAGLLEGVVPSSGQYTDHFFNYPQVTGKSSDAPDPWSELGMRYAGRLTFTFEPMVASGGLKEFGFVVYQDESQVAEESRSADHGKNVTDRVIVLNRINEVTREHTWEPGIDDVLSGSLATAEEILDNIRRLTNVAHVEMQTASDGGWIVMADLVGTGPDGMRRGIGTTLREAALDCYGKCGVPVMHFDSEPRAVSESKILDERIAGV